MKNETATTTKAKTKKSTAKEKSPAPQNPQEVGGETAKQLAKKAGSKSAKSNGKSAGETTPAKSDNAEANVLYRINREGGVVESISREEAVKDLLAYGHEQDTIDAFFGSKNALISDTHVYAPTDKILRKAMIQGKIKETVAESAETGAADAKSGESGKTPETPNTEQGAVDFKAGDTVYNIIKKILGTVVEKDGVLRIQATVGGKLKSTERFGAWRLATDEEKALVKSDAIAGEVVPSLDTPLSEDEKQDLARLESEAFVAKSDAQTATNVFIQKVSEINVRKLFRGTHKSFKDYAIDVFGIDDKYATNLAQLGKYQLTAGELLPESASINTRNELARSANRLSEELGLGKAEFKEVSPIIKASLRVLTEVAPKDKDNNPVLTPRLVSVVAEKIHEVVSKETVEYEGKQYTVEQAKELGLTDTAFRSMVIQQTSEGILAQHEIIKSESKQAYERQNEPIKPPASPPKSTETYDGELPELGLSCSLHGEVTVKSIGTGKFETSCGCRFMISTATEKLTAFEVGGKRVKS